jgi:hypothetical protein
MGHRRYGLAEQGQRSRLFGAKLGRERRASSIVLHWKTQRDSALFGQSNTAIVAVDDAVLDQSIDLMARGSCFTASDLQ